MNPVRSIGVESELAFVRRNGEVLDRGEYVVARTLSNPEYMQGNFIMFRAAPRSDQLQAWKNVFAQEQGHVDGFVNFTWDALEDTEWECQSFFDAGFELEPSLMLEGTTLRPPPRLNRDLTVRQIQDARAWTEVVELQVACRDPKYPESDYRAYKQKQFANYRQMASHGDGGWFGAYLGERLVGDLGLYCAGGNGRYQMIETHPEFRGRGVCGTLVYGVGQLGRQRYGLERLLILADPDSDCRAIGIYSSLGFVEKERIHFLCWERGGAG